MTTKDRPTTWADHKVHHLKRELSRFEKSSMANTRLATGQALIMPAMPGTEVEELLAVGFHPRFIHAIEEQQTLADNLYEHYWDEITVHWEEVSNFLRRCKSREGFSYIHLDYCGHLRKEQVQGINYAMDRLADNARCRVSVMLSRRGEEQQDYELMVGERILRNLVEAASQMTGAAHPWIDLLERVLVQMQDSTVPVAAIMFLHAVFGLQAYEYTDQCVREGAFLPRPLGRHRIINLHRMYYKEVTNANVMGTIWITVGPQLGEQGSPELAIEELLVLLRALAIPSLQFANPALFH